VVLAALTALRAQGKVTAEACAAALAQLSLDAEAAAPWTV
jgi:pyruvate dehydrogenase complex dehydrogenase (E1) component